MSSGKYQIIGDDDDDDTPISRPTERASMNSAETPGAHVAPPAPQPPAAAGAGGGYITVMVPQDWQAGQHLMIPIPGRAEQQVVAVPPGLQPGSQFRVPIPAVGQQLLAVTVPQGVVPGQQLTVKAPNGQLFMATVPPGHGAGATFQMAIPAAAAQAPAGAPPPAPLGPSPEQVSMSATDSANQMKETATLLGAMLDAVEPGENVQENELVQELVRSCQESLKLAQRILEDVSDESAMMAMLEANDHVTMMLGKYEALLVSGAAQPPAQPPAQFVAPPAAPAPVAPVAPPPAMTFEEPTAVAPKSEADELADMFGGGAQTAMAAPAFMPPTAVVQPTPAAPAFAPPPAPAVVLAPPPSAAPQGSLPPLRGTVVPDSKPAATGLEPPPAAAAPLAPPPSTQPAVPVDVGVAATGKTDAQLDDEANNLLAEFDSLIGDMGALSTDSTSGLAITEPPAAPRVETEKDDASLLGK